MLKLAFHDMSAKRQRVCSFEFAWGENVSVDVAQSTLAHIITINFKIPLKIKVISYANAILGCCAYNGRRKRYLQFFLTLHISYMTVYALRTTFQLRKDFFKACCVIPC